MMQPTQSTQDRAALIHRAAALVSLAKSAQESILLGDYAQAAGNLEALQSVKVDLQLAARALTISEHMTA